MFSSVTSTSRGIVVMFENSFTYEILQTVSDHHGNYIIIDIKAKGQQFTLCALYGPNEDRPDFFLNISRIIDNMNNLSIILASDWNVVLGYEKDTCFTWSVDVHVVLGLSSRFLSTFSLVSTLLFQVRLLLEQIQSTPVISNSKGLTETLRDIRTSTYQSWESEENNKLNNHI